MKDWNISELVEMLGDVAKVASIAQAVSHIKKSIDRRRKKKLTLQQTVKELESHIEKLVQISNGLLGLIQRQRRMFEMFVEPKKGIIPLLGTGIVELSKRVKMTEDTLIHFGEAFSKSTTLLLQHQDMVKRLQAGAVRRPRRPPRKPPRL
jgi:hypothetical protein